MIQAPLDTQIKVSSFKYSIAIRMFAGIIAYRKDHRGFYIKRLMPGYRKELEHFLNT